MAWRPAQSLQVLRDQLDAAYPGWLFLGFLGDAAHQSVPSDHNPNADGVVCALDIGPGGGLKIHELADRLLEKRHPDLKYIISNYRIAGDFTGWNWGYYDGIDPHDTHIHVSVGRGPDGQSTQPYDDTIKWNIGGDVEIGADGVDLLFRYIIGRPADKGAIQTYQQRTDWKSVAKELSLQQESKNYLKKISDGFQCLSVPKEFEQITEPIYRKK